MSRVFAGISLVVGVVLPAFGLFADPVGDPNRAGIVAIARGSSSLRRGPSWR